VLGHRGASAYLPEHTLASYELAIEQQEFLEFLCMGIDGVFADSPDTAVTARMLFWGAFSASCRPFPR
jgi:glycerophosphoryl diester phosphodiesterase